MSRLNLGKNIQIDPVTGVTITSGDGDVFNFSPSGGFNVSIKNTFSCPGSEDEDEGGGHLVPRLKTAYGERAVCRSHRRVWTQIADQGWVEEKYADGGMIGHG